MLPVTDYTSNPIRRLYRRLDGLLVFIILAVWLASCSDAATPAPRTSPTLTTTSNPAVTGNITSGPVPTGSAQPAKNTVPLIGPSQVDAKTFQPVWKITLEDNTSAVMVGESEGLVFVRTLTGGLYALNAANGTLVWRHPAPPLAGSLPAQGPYAFVGQGLAVIGDPSSEKLTAYETRSGTRKWEASLKFDAPNRDAGSRFLGGRLYDTTLVVAISSKQDPFAQQGQTSNPEYVMVSGLELATGKEVWSAVTDPPPANNPPARPGNVIFGSKLVLVESPDGQVGAIEGDKGKRRWRAFNLFLLRSNNPDAIYSLSPEGPAEHNPRLRKIDPETGNLLWEKVLPIKVREDPPVFVASDERTAYMIAIVTDKESYMFGFDLETVKPLWRHPTSTYGPYTLTPDNNGVRLRNFGKTSGLVYFKREDPSTPVWLAGGLEMGDELEAAEGLYLTAKLDQNTAALFLLDPSNGAIRYTVRTETTSGPPLAGATQVYLPTTGAGGKPVITAYTRS